MSTEHELRAVRALPNSPFYFYQARRLRRWPGVSAGLSLAEARPAHAGPIPGGTQIKSAQRHTGRVPRTVVFLGSRQGERRRGKISSQLPVPGGPSSSDPLEPEMAR